MKLYKENENYILVTDNQDQVTDIFDTEAYYIKNLVVLSRSVKRSIEPLGT